MNRSVRLIFNCFVFFMLLSIVTAGLPVFAGPLANDGATLTVNTVGDGSVSTTPDSETYTLGDSVSLTASPNSGWTFAGWDGDLSSTAPWWDTNWRYRTVICVHANGYERVDKPVDASLDFTQLLQAASKVGMLDLNSLRVVEVDSFGNIIDANVPFQFDPSDTFDAASDASGTLIFMMANLMGSEDQRLFHVYFDTTNSGTNFTPATVAPQVALTQSVLDESMDSYKFTNQNASYYLQKRAGGFSSIVDQDGADWVGYSSAPEAAGEYRGIPNLIHPEGQFHPGANNSISTIAHSGPLKVTAVTETIDGAWKAIWEIYPEYATMTVVTADHGYWFLYEGTPGGELDFDDEVYLSNSSNAYPSLSSSQPIWGDDLSGEEWGYIADPNSGANGRSIFFAHHEEDDTPDWYSSYGNPPAAMTIFGFGRDGTDAEIMGTPQHFTLGLMDEINYSSAPTIIRSAYKDLAVNIGVLEDQSDGFTYEPGTSSPFAILMNVSRHLTATFVPDYFAIQPEINGNGSVAISAPANPAGYAYGETITITATANVGSSFVGWSGYGSGSANPLVTAVTSNGVITATFAPNQYTLTLVPPSSGGSISASPSSSTYAYGTPIQLAATISPGYQFDGWSGALDSLALAPTITITQDMTITAGFSQEPYSVIVNTVGGGLIAAQPNLPHYYYDDQLTVTATAQPGWSFVGWSGDLSGAVPNESLTIQQDAIITGTFAQEQYVLTTNVTGSGNVIRNPIQSTYVYDDLVTLTASPAEHWDFVGWSGDFSSSPSSNTAMSITVTMTDSKSLVANYAPHLYTIAINTTGDGTVNNLSTQTGYAFGELITLTATPNNGWTFGGWSGDHAASDAATTLIVNGDMNVVATFEGSSYALNTAVSGNGSVGRKPDYPLYSHGELVELTASPQPGWRFVGWAGAVTGANNLETITVASSENVTATFEQETYTVEVNNIGNGAINATPQQATYLYGDLINVAATAPAGWYFNGWQGALTGVQSTTQLTVTQNSVITGTFSQSPYGLVTNVVGNGQVQINPNRSSYIANETIAVVAIPDSGWVFAGWSGDLVSSDVNETFTIVSNHSITATFEEIIDDTDNQPPDGSPQIFIYLPAVMPSP